MGANSTSSRTNSLQASPAQKSLDFFVAKMSPGPSRGHEHATTSSTALFESVKTEDCGETASGYLAEASTCKTFAEHDYASHSSSSATSTVGAAMATRPKTSGTRRGKGSKHCGSSGKKVSRKSTSVKDGAPPAKRKKTKTGRSLTAPLRECVAGDVDRNVTWCKQCRKRLNPLEIIFFNGDCEDAVEEPIALTDPMLTSSLCSLDQLMEQPQFKITQFTVYDEHGHVCAFDDGLIEADVPLYMSGYVKSICAEDPCIQDSIAVARAGPVVSWWTTGYDGGSNIVLGLTTQFAEYILMAPSAQYEPYIKRMEEKIYLIKGILEKLIECDGAVAFDDMMSHLESLYPPRDSERFSLETLHRHSQFLLDHIQAYDSAGVVGDDTPLMDNGFVYELMRVTGVVPREVSKGNMRPLGLRKVPKRTDLSAAFVMPAVERTLEDLFRGRDQSAKILGVPRKNRCNLCEACLAQDCRVCTFCRNMKKHGGTGTMKQCCVRRQCQQRNPRCSEDHLGVDTMDREVSNLLREPLPKRVFFRKSGRKFFHSREKREAAAGRTVFSSCRIGSGLNVSVGSDILVMSSSPGKRYLGRVMELYEDREGNKFAHVLWFRQYEETVLGSSFAGCRGEVFLTTECESVSLAAVVDVCCVVVLLGDDAVVPVCAEEKRFYCRFLCDVATCTFVALQSVTLTCRCAQSQSPPTTHTYRHNDCVFVKPDAVPLPLKSSVKVTASEAPSAGEALSDEFTERYRKNLCAPKIEVPELPSPYRICRVVANRAGKGKLNTTGTIIVQPFYRDCEVRKASRDNIRLFLSTETFSIPTESVVSPCEVVYSEGGCLGNCFDMVRPPFYFSQCYNGRTGVLSEPSSKEKSIGLCLVSKVEKTHRTLNSVDVYGGCGGLSLGLAEAGVAVPMLAVGDNEHHLNTFNENFDHRPALHRCPSKVLKHLHTAGMTEILGGLDKEQIDLVCGSPSFESHKSCRFLQGCDKQGLRNSQLVTFLGFCAFFDPSYVVLVAERCSVRYHNGDGLALALKCLLDLGYQTSCSMLQDGCYGMPQRHRRLVIFGARRGRANLPAFPLPTHAFEVPECHLSFAVNGRAYSSPLSLTSAAPYQRTTLKDAIGDLSDPEAQCGAGLSDFSQCHHRNGPVDYDCHKKLSPLSQARIAAIPKVAGSDWRDLPNREVELTDGTTAYRLIYTHLCSASPYVHRRGVCPCAENDKALCDPMCRQENTFIPWSLVHTGHRSGQWAGVYGRLQWDGYLHGVVANPEPLSKQGPVIHPDKDRVISVRECARIQGYPDDYKFVGPLPEQYKMIAVSVPPLLAQALGREMAKVLQKEITGVAT
ncbi:hypothetical protein V5799_033698 [Amblyomma americanum]|uniref:DNA (cytosine-5-)-methyltransferase n=1 Tax=Amblyomma americanum TaxID=6943 RepID=A0AAQ4DMK5_AMBAM